MNDDRVYYYDILQKYINVLGDTIRLPNRTAEPPSYTIQLYWHLSDTIGLTVEYNRNRRRIIHWFWRRGEGGNINTVEEVLEDNSLDSDMQIKLLFNLDLFEKNNCEVFE